MIESSKELELHDWFAGQALGGLLANGQYPLQGSGEPFDQFAARLVDTAYKLADAMVRQGRIIRRERRCG